MTRANSTYPHPLSLLLHWLSSLSSGRSLNTMIDQLLCNHEYIIKTKPKHLYLECMKCKKETKGWNV